jgi:hypothetical protein
VRPLPWFSRIAGNGPRPDGRHNWACNVAPPLWTTTISGPILEGCATIAGATLAAKTMAANFMLPKKILARDAVQTQDGAC